METLKTATNSLMYSVTKTKNGIDYIIKIRLSDECKNGHQDFSITGESYPTKKRGDRNMICASAMGDEIVKQFPEFKIFNDLHLCDYLGTPMYAVANGFYHLENGFSNTPKNSPKFESKFCEYYRISNSDFKILSKSRNKIEYGIILMHLNIPKKWEAEAKEAILKLEELTGDKFKVDSERTQLDVPTSEEIADFNNKLKSAYFEPKQIKKREAEEVKKKINEKIVSINKEIESKKEEIVVIKALAKAGGLKAVENAIFYNHARQLNFNWKSYDQLTIEEINKIKAKIKLPKGVQITVDKK